MSASAQLFLLGRRAAERLPEEVVRGLLRVAGEVVWLRRTAGVRRLEANLARVRPTADRRELRRLSRAGMRTYMRYYAEVFTLGRLTRAQVDARVRVVGVENPLGEVRQGRSVVLAVGHQGNWDLAGAWSTVHIAPVTTVAERLEPAEVFEEFLRLRESIGLTIIPLDAGKDVFRDLVRAVRAGGTLVPLLADRDLTARGIEVDLFGERARVAAGPAVLAVTTGARLMPTTIHHERLRGARRRAAGSRWGVVIEFHEPVDAVGGTRAERVARLTQAWVDVVAADIARHPTHWHMLQRVFLADLDPTRLAPAAGARDAAASDSAASDSAATDGAEGTVPR